jgi:hypothetical protein
VRRASQPKSVDWNFRNSAVYDGRKKRAKPVSRMLVRVITKLWISDFGNEVFGGAAPEARTELP